MKMYDKAGELTTDPDNAHVFIFDDEEEKPKKSKKQQDKTEKFEEKYF